MIWPPVSRMASPTARTQILRWVAVVSSASKSNGAPSLRQRSTVRVIASRYSGR
ncbi:hypothetical protein D9M68_680570 [compost metagenome]